MKSKIYLHIRNLGIIREIFTLKMKYLSKSHAIVGKARVLTN